MEAEYERCRLGPDGVPHAAARGLVRLTLWIRHWQRKLSAADEAMRRSEMPQFLPDIRIAFELTRYAPRGRGPKFSRIYRWRWLAELHRTWFEMWDLDLRSFWSVSPIYMKNGRKV